MGDSDPSLTGRPDQQAIAFRPATAADAARAVALDRRGRHPRAQQLLRLPAAVRPLRRHLRGGRAEGRAGRLRARLPAAQRSRGRCSCGRSGSRPRRAARGSGGRLLERRGRPSRPARACATSPPRWPRQHRVADAVRRLRPPRGVPARSARAFRRRPVCRTPPRREPAADRAVLPAERMRMEIIERLESDVRSYCRSFPTVFDRAEGAHLFDDEGRTVPRLLRRRGRAQLRAQPPALRDALVEYLTRGGVAHSLDMATDAKCDFSTALEQRVLRPRDLRYKMMFPGPTGTNAVEAALKLARKVTGRTQVVSFTNAFHGMTLGALATTGNAQEARRAPACRSPTSSAPRTTATSARRSTPLAHLEALAARDRSSGIEAPAAFIVETVQGEGGVNVASARLAARARGAGPANCGALLIVDDIQVGCGRTGAFFSFEEAGLSPDIVCLSKSLSGFGLPFAADPDAARARRLEPGRAQRHVPRQQPGVRHRHRGARALLVRRPPERPGRGEGAPSRGPGWRACPTPAPATRPCAAAASSWGWRSRIPSWPPAPPARRSSAAW